MMFAVFIWNVVVFIYILRKDKNSGHVLNNNQKMTFAFYRCPITFPNGPRGIAIGLLVLPLAIWTTNWSVFA